MPKGIYNRNKSKGIESIVVNHADPQPNLSKSSGTKTVFTNEEVTPETANAKVVEVAPQIDGADDESTTQRLFGAEIAPEQIEALSSTSLPQNPEEEIEETEAPEPIEEVKPPEPIKPIQSQEIEKDILDLDKFGSRKIKTKIDGIDGNVTLESLRNNFKISPDELSDIAISGMTIKDLKDRFQLQKHLNQAGEKLGKERQRLAEERRAWMEEQQRTRGDVQSDEQNGSVPRGTMPTYDPVLTQRMQAMERQLAEMNQERARNQVVRELKEDGIENPEQYFAKAQVVMASNLDLAPFYDTPHGFKTLVKALVFEERKSPPPSTIKPILPAKIESTGTIQRPPITRIDSGSIRSSGNNDDARLRYRDNFKRAVQNGSDTPAGREAWNQVLLQKGIIPDS